ncbi:MAG TPA: hypothetical protein DCQ30_01810 [Acidimicrobiaceae bacterium]|nr:hypothetical protein [Acidimicrobiaceae bacterium]
MEDLAPAVVAVIVACDPGPWFEETLQSFALQDYPELAVLVLDAGSAEDPTPRVAAVLPNAFVRRLPENAGFAAAADAVLGMVAGASHLLLCHDDVALDPNVVHVLVEESFRSNAGIVSPKLVAWDDPSRLLHVGMAVDKGGAVVDRVEPGEIDHGQHDGVRDVFLAPGGCMLVRADLFAELGGFDPAVVALGDDLDLCWRAQVAGARVIVAPAARVRHLERLAAGDRPLPGGAPSLQALQRRHELRIVLVAYSTFHLLRVLPQVVFLSAGEFAVAVLTGNRPRARGVLHAWSWNWSRRKELRAARAALRERRRLPDSEVRRLQVRGSARLTAYVRRLFAHGLEAAHAGAAALPALISATAPDGDEGSEAAGGAALVNPAGALAPATALGTRRRSGVVRNGAGPQPAEAPVESGAAASPPLSLSARTVVWAAVGLVLLIGSRQLLGNGLPSMAGLLSWPAWTTLLHRFGTGWHAPGLGGVNPTSPATGPLGLLALVLGGSSGLVQKVIVLGCLPVGAWGLARLARPFGSPRGRLAATLVYLALPVAYDALALGRWDALVAYAAAPWVAARLARASDLEPFASGYGSDRAGRLRRRRLLRQVIGLGVLEAVFTMLVPAGAALTLLMAAGLSAGALVALGPTGWRPVRRMTGAALGATAVTVVLLAPWSFTMLAGSQRWQAVTGLALLPGTGPGWSSLLRLAVGPIGDSPLAYGLVVAAVLPLLVAVRHRLTWAAMAWGLVLSSWLVCWTEGKGWTAGFNITPLVLLAPAAVGVALAAGLGMAAFEQDLSAHRFGWRQVATVLAAAGVTVGALPVLAAAGGGRWDLPTSGYGEATAWLSGRAPAGGFRALWLADPRALPGGGWQLEPGVAYAVTDGGLPDSTGLWVGSHPASAATVADDVRLAQRHRTVQLGQLLAASDIHYVVVVQSLAPIIPGYQSPALFPVPATLTDALSTQSDLTAVPGQSGAAIYVNEVKAAGPVGANLESSWTYRGVLYGVVVVWLLLVVRLARPPTVWARARRRRSRGGRGTSRSRAGRPPAARPRAGAGIDAPAGVGR